MQDNSQGEDDDPMDDVSHWAANMPTASRTSDAGEKDEEESTNTKTHGDTE
jgi:hypothetical protein